MRTKLLKFLKRVLYIILSGISLIVLAYFLFVRFNPAFGGDVTPDMKASFKATSEQHKSETFENIDGVDDDIDFGKGMTIMRKMLFESNPNAKPQQDIPVIKVDSASVADYSGDMRLMWFGHSAFLLQTNGRNVLIDPMLTQMPSPISRDAQKRFYEDMPLEIEKLPHIDAVLISHDHYDHLDYKSINRLRQKVKMFYVPLGVGVHLKTWGIEASRIVEMDWWEQERYLNFEFIAAPAQHFSGRKINNRNSTLWCSWIIKNEHHTIYFSGDGGYNGHFKEIGRRYGPFDFAMLECGQYNDLWPKIHMMPEETVQAGIDLNAKCMMPIHWGAFSLALHDWNDPVIRAQKKAIELNIPLVTPKIGEFINLDRLFKDYQPWWK